MAVQRQETDVVVVGSGAAGLSAALTARAAGLDVIILERSDMVAGTTALAGGGLWIPANHFMLADGDHDSAETALKYLEDVVGDEGPATSTVRKRAFVENAPKVIRFLEELGLKFRRTTGYPDYHPDRPGASVAGRGIESVVFNMNKLGPWADRFPRRPFPRTMPMGTLNVAQLWLARRSMSGFFTYVRIFLHFLWGKVTGRKLRAGGNALSGQMLHHAIERGVKIQSQTAATGLIVENKRITGLRATGPGGIEMEFHARRAVFLGAGGFARNAEMRQRYQPAPVTGAWSSAAKSDFGDGIRMGVEAGAAVALMDEAWWSPSAVLPTGNAVFLTSERAKPGSIMVDGTANRYFNEAISYVDAGHEMIARNKSNTQAIPSWLIFDQTFRNRYPFGTMFPMITPKAMIESGFFRRADTIQKLAEMCKLDPKALEATIKRFNGFAISGKDEDFGRGNDAYDRFFGDPKVKPNPCLAPIVKPPFYAVAVYLGDLGTKGGLITDEHGRVLREDGSVIEGLYASGNTTASVMGRRYPGPGVTLGPAITFAHLAMKHAAGAPKKSG